MQQEQLLQRAFHVLWRIVHCPERLFDAFEQNRPIEPELDALQPRLPVLIAPANVIDAVQQYCDAVEHLHGRLAEVGVGVPEKMAAEVRTLAKIAWQQGVLGDSRPDEGTRR